MGTPNETSNNRTAITEPLAVLVRNVITLAIHLIAAATPHLLCSVMEALTRRHKHLLSHLDERRHLIHSMVLLPNGKRHTLLVLEEELNRLFIRVAPVSLLGIR